MFVHICLKQVTADSKNDELLKQMSQLECAVYDKDEVMWKLCNVNVLSMISL